MQVGTLTLQPSVFCQQLPRIDAVVISHSHYDHLDAGSVASLNTRFGGTLRWYVLTEPR